MEPVSGKGAEVAGTGPGWRPWLRVALAVLALLVASEALWLWQTWPVRELLQPPATSRPAGAR